MTWIRRPMTERLSNIKFTENLEGSQYVKPLRMSFERNGMSLTWDMAFETDSVATILYNKTVNKLLCVKQFRPPVFVRNVLRLPENKGKSHREVDFTKYDLSLGMTLELCAGILDKPLSPVEIAREEILEECGYDVEVGSIKLIKNFVDGVGMSAAEQYLFFASITDDQRVAAGGGNAHEGECIEPVYLSVAEAEQYLKTGTNSPPSFLFGLSYFLAHRNELLM